MFVCLLIAFFFFMNFKPFGNYFDHEQPYFFQSKLVLVQGCATQNLFTVWNNVRTIWLML